MKAVYLPDILIPHLSGEPDPCGVDGLGGVRISAHSTLFYPPSHPHHTSLRVRVCVCVCACVCVCVCVCVCERAHKSQASCCVLTRLPRCLRRRRLASAGFPSPVTAL